MKKAMSLLFMFLLASNIAFADSIVFKSGATLDGRIDSAMEGLILIKTKNGTVKVVREMNWVFYQDRIDVKPNFFSKKLETYKGKIIYIDDSGVKIRNNQGEFKFKRNKVKDIILYHPE